jgi:hypothetical protein
VSIRRIDIGPPFQQELDESRLSLLRGQHQRRRPGGIAGIDVSACIDESCGDPRVVKLDRSDQRRLVEVPTSVLVTGTQDLKSTRGGIGISALAQEHLHPVEVALLDSIVEILVAAYEDG